MSQQSHLSYLLLTFILIAGFSGTSNAWADEMKDRNCLTIATSDGQKKIICGKVVIPGSSIPDRPGEAHTNTQIFIPQGATVAPPSR